MSVLQKNTGTRLHETAQYVYHVYELVSMRAMEKLRLQPAVKRG